MRLLLIAPLLLMSFVAQAKEPGSQVFKVHHTAKWQGATSVDEVFDIEISAADNTYRVLADCDQRGGNRYIDLLFERSKPADKFDITLNFCDFKGKCTQMVKSLGSSGFQYHFESQGFEHMGSVEKQEGI